MIETSAILASVHLTKMSGSCIDKGITERVLNTEHAQGGAGKWSTELFPNGALKPIAKIDGDIRKYFLSQTLPWADSGVRLLPQVRFMEYTNELNNLSVVRAQAIDKFFADYPHHISEAQRILGNLFRPEQYPSEIVARNKFVMKSDIQPVPSVGDFRTDAPKEELEAMRQSLEAKMERAKTIAETDLASRIAEPLAALVAKLTEPPKDGKQPIFRDTLITNIRDIVSEIPAFNITGNPKFAQIHQLLSGAGSLANFAPDMVRTNPDVKKLAVEQAGLFLDKLNDIFGPSSESVLDDAA